MSSQFVTYHSELNRANAPYGAGPFWGALASNTLRAGLRTGLQAAVQAGARSGLRGGLRAGMQSAAKPMLQAGAQALAKPGMRQAVRNVVRAGMREAAYVGGGSVLRGAAKIGQRHASNVARNAWKSAKLMGGRVSKQGKYSALTHEGRSTALQTLRNIRRNALFPSRFTRLGSNMRAYGSSMLNRSRSMMNRTRATLFPRGWRGKMSRNVLYGTVGTAATLPLSFLPSLLNNNSSSMSNDYHYTTSGHPLSSTFVEDNEFGSTKGTAVNQLYAAQSRASARAGITPPSNLERLVEYYRPKKRSRKTIRTSTKKTSSKKGSAKLMMESGPPVTLQTGSSIRVPIKKRRGKGAVVKSVKKPRKLKLSRSKRGRKKKTSGGQRGRRQKKKLHLASASAFHNHFAPKR